MRSAILITGNPDAYARQKYGSYGDCFRDLLCEPGHQFSDFDVRQGEFPAAIDDFDAYLVTGSAATAHETLPWITQLNRFLARAYAAGAKILGICFGHQAVANALGGQSARNPAGWEVGLHQLELAPELARVFPHQPAILEIHRDHVVALPPGAKVLAKTVLSPIQIFAIGEQVLCLQGHPEFHNDMVASLVEKRGRDGMIPPETVAACHLSLKGRADRDLWIGYLKNFLYH